MISKKNSPLTLDVPHPPPPSTSVIIIGGYYSTTIQLFQQLNIQTLLIIQRNIVETVESTYLYETLYVYTFHRKLFIRKYYMTCIALRFEYKKTRGVFISTITATAKPPSNAIINSTLS